MSEEIKKPREWHVREWHVNGDYLWTSESAALSDGDIKDEDNYAVKVIEFSAFEKAIETLKAWHEFEKAQVAKEGPYVGKAINELIKRTDETLRELGVVK